jgi:ABC-type transporter Mla MlaB component
MHSAQSSDALGASISHIAAAERASIRHLVGDTPSLRRVSKPIEIVAPADAAVVLRITTAYQLAAETGAAYILELKGRLQDDSVDALRRAWRPLRDAVPEVPIRVVLADVEFADAAGKALLAEMQRAGALVVQQSTSEGSSVHGIDVRAPVSDPADTRRRPRGPRDAAENAHAGSRR